jgi:antitoxin HicB
MEYPIQVEHQDNETVLVSFPDFPEAHTFGIEPEALAQASEALTTVLDAYIREYRDIPQPSVVPESRQITVPALVAAKVLLYRTMRSAHVSRAELARRMVVYPPQVHRLLDVRHGSQLDQFEAAFEALGKRFVVATEDVPALLTSGADRTTGHSGLFGPHESAADESLSERVQGSRDVNMSVPH